MRTLELRIPPVVFVQLLGAAMAATAHFTPALGFNLPGGPILAAGFAGAGVIIALLGFTAFRRAQTTVNPLQPAAASHLVVAGIYRHTRNPMYLGMLLVLLAWGLFLGNALGLGLALLFIPLMNRLQIGPEERILTSLFGRQFTTYQSTVRRWL
jgi:protein-S-isoprenylcysteine O-methyltransferase Ste14